jgi:hypothetical protein
VTVSVATGLVTPPALAVMSAVPEVTPVTNPVVLMLATFEALFCQVNVVVTVTPEMSTAVAVNCCCPPTAMEAVVGEMLIEAITGVTVSVDGVLTILELVAEVAMICAVPGVTPVATPEGLMVAMFGELLVQMKVAPVMAFPAEFVATAVKFC